MAFCGKCGTKVDADAIVCPNCGSPIPANTNPSGQSEWQDRSSAAAADQVLSKLNDTKDSTEEFDDADIRQGKAMSVLCYLGLLVLVPFFGFGNSKFIRFHTNQGLLLFITEIIYTFIVRILLRILYFINWRLGYLGNAIFDILYLAFLALAILGIVNVINGKAKELPVIGSIHILK